MCTLWTMLHSLVSSFWLMATSKGAFIGGHWICPVCNGHMRQWCLTCWFTDFDWIYKQSIFLLFASKYNRSARYFNQVKWSVWENYQTLYEEQFSDHLIQYLTHVYWHHILKYSKHLNTRLVRFSNGRFVWLSNGLVFIWWSENRTEKKPVNGPKCLVFKLSNGPPSPGTLHHLKIGHPYYPDGYCIQ